MTRMMLGLAVSAWSGAGRAREAAMKNAAKAIFSEFRIVILKCLMFDAN
jgi:hypothetical protein